MGKERVAQLEYSEFQGAMLDEAKRRRKAAKIVAVLAHFLGTDGKHEPAGREALDHGSNSRASNIGNTSHGAFRDGAGRDGAVRDGAVRDGAVRDGAVRDGAVRDGAVRDGAVRDGAVRDGAVRDGDLRDGAGRDGAVRDGAVRDGAGRDGAVRDDVGREGERVGGQPAVLAGLAVADIGCSAGFIADELAAAGASRTFGVDIDVPGLRKAAERFGGRVRFVCGDGTALPFPDNSVDVLVFNHIYEHVVDPDAVVAEMHRVLSEDGVLYLGLGNRLGVMEPHYKLPFLSYLPPSLADRYVRLSGRADHYYERFRTRRGLRRMLKDFHVWDYTFPVLVTPARFAGSELFPGAAGRLAGGVLARMPRFMLRALLPVVPTYLWVATKTPRSPRGSELPRPPERVRTP